MDVNREELSKIKEVLKANPRGMNVLEISRAIKMHRQSVAKYLEMLAISGHVDVKTFGPAKVYYISQRLPVSSMLSLSSDLIVILDRAMKVVNANERFLDFISVKREDVLNKDFEAISPTLDLEPSIMPNIADALSGKESTIEAFLKHKGDERFFSVKFIPVVFEEGQQGATILMEDVTNERLVDHTIRESEEKLNIIMDKLHAGAVIYQGDNIVDASRSVEWMTEYSHEDILKMRFWELVAPEFREVVRQRGFARQTGEQPPASYECKLASRDGKLKWVELNASYVTYRGMPAGLITLFDITGRKVIGEKQKESEALFAHTQHISGMGSWKWDLVSDKISVSDEAYRIVGVPVADQFISLDRFLSYVHPDDRAMALSKIYESLHMKGKYSTEIRIIRGDGAERLLHVEEEIAHDDAGKPVAMYGIMQDITDDRHMNAEWSNLVDRLNETNDRLSVIMYVSESVVNTQSLEDTLLTILQRLVRAMGADAGAVMLKESDRVNVKASIGFDEAALAKLSGPAARGYSGTITASGEPLYLEDLQSDPRAISPVLKDLGFKTVVGVPIKDRMEMIGVLHMEWKSVHPHKKQDFDVLNIIADRCSAAIINAMLYRKNKKLQLQSQYKTAKGF